MKHNKKKRGQYFTLDAFIATMVLAVGLIIIFSIRTTSSYSKQPLSLSQDLGASLTALNLREINNPLIINMTLNGTINNLDNTVLQQAAEFYIENHASFASDLVRNVSTQLVPPQYSFEVIINNDLIYSRDSSQDSSQKNQSQLLVASRKILFGVVNKTVQPWGPLIGEVVVWE